MATYVDEWMSKRTRLVKIFFFCIGFLPFQKLLFKCCDVLILPMIANQDKSRKPNPYYLKKYFGRQSSNNCPSSLAL